MVTSLVWQWSGFLVGQLSHVNIVQTAALLPWLLWAVDGYGAGGGRKYGLLAALFVCLQAFTGHQQTLAYSLLLACAYAVCMAFASRRRDARTRYLSSLLLMAAGVALAAVQILPTLELLRNSVRSEATYEFFSSFSLPPRLLWTFVAPYVFGGGDKRLFLATYVGPPFYGEFIGYVGAATLALAALALDTEARRADEVLVGRGARLPRARARRPLAATASTPPSTTCPCSTSSACPRATCWRSISRWPSSRAAASRTSCRARANARASSAGRSPSAARSSCSRVSR